MKMQEATELMAAWGAKEGYQGDTIRLTWGANMPNLCTRGNAPYWNCYGENLSINLCGDSHGCKLWVNCDGTFGKFEVD